MQHGSMYGHKGMSGAYGKSKSGGSGLGSSSKVMHGKNPLKGRTMPKGGKELTASHKGYAIG